MATRSFDWGGFFGQTWPSLMLYVAGFIVALVMMGRYRTPAVLALISMALLIVSTFAPAFYNQMIDFGRESPESIRQRYLISGMIANIIRAGGIGLLLWAVFCGRPRDAQTGYGFGVMQQYPPQGYGPPPQYGTGMPPQQPPYPPAPSSRG